MKLEGNSGYYMGEVRTKVRLFNNADANAAAEGKLAVEKVRVIEADAMVDTGAVRCALAFRPCCWSSLGFGLMTG